MLKKFCWNGLMYKIKFEIILMMSIEEQYSKYLTSLHASEYTKNYLKQNLLKSSLSIY